MLKKFSVLIITMFISLVGVSQAHAARFESFDESHVFNEYVDDDNLYIEAASDITISNTVEKDLYITGENIVIDGDVFGNVYLFGGTVTINGDIARNVYVMAGDVEINGEVLRDVFVMGGTVNINSAVYEDVNVFASELEINSSVEDIRAAGGDISITSEVSGDVFLAASKAFLSGIVGGDVYLASENADFTDLEVKGDLISDVQQKVEDGLVVSGIKEFHNQGDDKDSSTSNTGLDINTDAANLVSSVFGAIVSMILSIVTIVVTGAFLLNIMPRKMYRYTEQLSSIEGLSKSVIYGIAGHIVGFTLVLLLFVTFVGYQVAFILLTIWVLAILTVGPIASISIYKLLAKNSSFTIQNQYLQLASGATIYVLLTNIPFVNTLVSLTAYLAVTGAYLRDKRSVMKQAKYQTSAVEHPVEYNKKPNSEGKSKKDASAKKNSSKKSPTKASKKKGTK